MLDDVPAVALERLVVGQGQMPADQRLGGLIMWVPAALIPLAAFTVVFFRWVAAEPDEETSRV